MTIDFTKPADGVPAVKADLRANLQDAEVRLAFMESDPFDFGGREVRGHLNPFQNAAGSQAAAESGRVWKLTADITGVPIINGWHAGYVNTSGSTKLITPASGLCVLLEFGTTAGNVTIPNNRWVVVHGDGTNLLIMGGVAG